MSKVALLNELLIGVSDAEDGSIGASMSTRHGDALKKAGIPDAAYKVTDYGLEVVDKNMHPKIMDALSKAGIICAADPEDNNKVVVQAK